VRVPTRLLNHTCPLTYQRFHTLARPCLPTIRRGGQTLFIGEVYIKLSRCQRREENMPYKSPATQTLFLQWSALTLVYTSVIASKLLLVNSRMPFNVTGWVVVVSLFTTGPMPQRFGKGRCRVQRKCELTWSTLNFRCTEKMDSLYAVNSETTDYLSKQHFTHIVNSKPGKKKWERLQKQWPSKYQYSAVV